MNDMEILMKGALLHDIGKICFRAGRKVNHSQAGADFLKKYLNDNTTIQVNNKQKNYQPQNPQKVLYTFINKRQTASFLLNPQNLQSPGKKMNNVVK
ncbi:MAG TPA: HD domain-containing protein, partial [Candidatus Megamonas gallistercoris]|nr:HD domain-containing protein [Candidatus Megamonas gallistercoris]